jgi:methyltransferase family protein
VSGLPKRTLTELFSGMERTTVKLPVPHLQRGAGMLPLMELLMLAAICEHVRPRKVFEIGTYRGASTLIMAMHTAASTEIFTLDLPSSATRTMFRVENGDITGIPFDLGEFYRESGFEGKIHQLYGDSAVFDFEPFYGQVDLVFVDGNHNYENVKHDSKNAFSILRHNGVIIWDDYHPGFGPGVMRALHELKGKALYQITGTRFAVYLDVDKRA